MPVGALVLLLPIGVASQAPVVPPVGRVGVAPVAFGQLLCRLRGELRQERPVGETRPHLVWRTWPARLAHDAGY